MNKKKALYGIVAMGIFFNWIMYLLFYGPGLAVLPFDFTLLAHLGILAHAGGLLHGAWHHSQGTLNPRFLKRVDTVSLLVILFVTVHLVFIQYTAINFWLVALFPAVGYAGGRMVIRWGAWFCSPAAADRRGLIIGSVILMSYTLLFMQTTFLTPENGGLLTSVAAGLVGGTMILKLPVLEGRYKKISLFSIMPPTFLLLFALLTFSLGALPYHVIFNAHIEYPLSIAVFALIAYMIPAALGWWSDYNSRYYLAVASLSFLGTGFSVWTVAHHAPPFMLVVQIFVFTGNLCASLFLWLFLADNESTDTMPMAFAVGVSMQTVIHMLTFASLPYIERSIIAYPPFINVLGVVFVFIGMTMLFAKNDRLSRMAVDVLRHKLSDGNKDNEYSLSFTASREYLTEEQWLRIRDRFNLTRRELNTMVLIVSGNNNKQISEKLFISLSTVKFHVRNILRKMNASNRHEIRDTLYKCLRD
jgi:DNA-binding CsgD family transcriptional regulator